MFRVAVGDLRRAGDACSVLTAWQAEGPSQSVRGLRLSTDRRLARAGCYGTLPVTVIFLPETIEFAVPRSSEECMPFARCKPENWTFGILAVANADLAIG